MVAAPTVVSGSEADADSTNDLGVGNNQKAWAQLGGQLGRLTISIINTNSLPGRLTD